MAKVTFDYSKAESFISNDEVNSMKEIAENAKKVLVERTGAGNDFLGWIDLPVDYDKEEFDRIKKAAAKIQSDSEVLIVIGIVDALQIYSTSCNPIPKFGTNCPSIISIWKISTPASIKSLTSFSKFL